MVAHVLTPWGTVLVPSYELVASFGNLSNHLKEWGKTDHCEVCASGACGQKNWQSGACLAHELRQHTTHFSARIALVYRCCLLPWPMRAASALRKTRNQFTGCGYRVRGRPVRYLLDTCVISEVTKPRPAARVLTWLDTQDELALFLSVITFGELQKGITKLPASRKRRQLQQWVDQELTRRFTGRILGIDREVALRWGVMAGTADRQGQPLPVLDGLLAATAVVAGLILVTRDTPHVRATGVALFDPWAG
jgi:predicted nucleic acid-binding protein